DAAGNAAGNAAAGGGDAAAGGDAAGGRGKGPEAPAPLFRSITPDKMPPEARSGGRSDVEMDALREAVAGDIQKNQGSLGQGNALPEFVTEWAAEAKVRPVMKPLDVLKGAVGRNLDASRG